MRKTHRGQRPESDEPLSAGRVEYLEQARARVRARRLRRTALIVAVLTAVVLFTTGRGTPFACPVPTMKISSNSALAARKPGWIDFDAGQLLNGVPMDTLADQLMDRVIAIASGTAHTHAESLDKHDLAIFKDGVTL